MRERIEKKKIKYVYGRKEIIKDLSHQPTKKWQIGKDQINQLHWDILRSQCNCFGSHQPDIDLLKYK